MNVRKAVIPAAGRGTRLFPATLEQPKEMLPVFSRGRDGNIYVKPLLQVVFEQLYDEGLREFCFVTGRAKRAIEDHFTPNSALMDVLRNKGKDGRAEEVERFYEK
ncbi:MAG: sugar phosphate nucleotidyltransferase, partial [Candidatus Bathyarchaeia archaeon]